jgi:hypothetical protein
MSPKRHLTHEGHTAPLQYWADKVNITKEALMQRLIGGWSVAEAVTIGKYNRPGKRIRRRLERLIADDQPKAHVRSKSLAITPLEQLKSEQLAMQRQFNSILRQFNRDLHAIMGRSLDRGVGLDLLKNANDRSIPVTRDRV